MGNLTLNNDQLRRLNGSYRDAGIKYVAMVRGSSAEVAAMTNGLLVLQIIHPENDPDPLESRTFLSILTHCRAFTELGILQGLRRVYILSNIDHSGARAGFLVPKGELSEAEMEEKLAEMEGFGKDTSLAWDEVIEREEVVELVRH